MAINLKKKLTNDDLLKDRTKENIELLLEKNNDLIIRIAKKYKKLINATSIITADDLIQTARFSFYQSIINYNPSIHNSKFATYAYNNVQNDLDKLAAKFYGVCKIPCYKLRLVNKIEEYSKLYRKLNGTNPTIREICDEFGQEKRKLRKLLKLSRRNISLNKIVDDENEEMIETITLNNKTPYEIYEDKNIIESVKYLVESSNLSDNERIILIELFGLFGHKKLTFEEVAGKHNITTQAVFQKLKNILRVLRDNKEINNYASLIDIDSPIKNDLGKGEMRKSRFNTLHNLFEKIPDCPKEKIIEAVNKLPQNQRELLYKRYGEDLSSKEPIETLTSYEKSIVATITFPAIQKYIDNQDYEYRPKKELCLLKRLKNYQKGEIVKAIEKLNSVYQDAIYLRYGEGLDEINPMPSDVLSLINLTIIPEIRSIIKERREELDNDYCSKLTYKENIDYSKLIEIIEFESFKEYTNKLTEYERNILLSIIKEEIQLEDINEIGFIARKTLAELIYGYYQYLKQKDSKETIKDKKVLEHIIIRIV